MSPSSRNEDSGSAFTYTVTLSQSSSSATTVNLIRSGTATSGTDYTGAVNSVVVPANATTASFAITPVADATVEADETVVVSVASGSGYSIGSPSSATATILNDDVPTASITVSPASVAEDGTANLIYTVTLDQAPLTAVSVAFTVGGTATSGSDYAAVSSPLVISAGQTSGTITINPTADSTVEANETVILSLAAGSGYSVGSPNSATGTINNDDVVVTVGPASLTAGTLGSAYSQTLSASGGTGPYTFAITAGAPPSGLALTTAGTLSGTPTAAGNASFTVTATDANGATGTASYTLTVAPAALAAPVAGSASATVAANSAVNPVTLALSGGTAASVAVASQAAHGTATASGTTIAYTPTVGFSGSDSFTYTATNATGTSSAATVTVTVTAPTLALTPASGALTGATVGSAYSQALAAANGTAPYSYAVTSGSLPTGLSLATGGTLSGTPTAAGNASFTVTATDANGATGTASYTLTVAPAALAAPVAGSASATVAANSAANPVTLALSGGTAASVAVASQAAHGTATASGTSISYMPTAGYSGSDSFTYTATNATGTSSPATVTVTVTAPTLALTPASGALTGATVGSAYSQALAAANGTAPYSYAVTSGTLPTGLSLATGGTLSGTPTAAGNASVTVTATDANGATGTASYTLAVAPAALAAPVAGSTSATVAANSVANPVTLVLSGGTAASVAVASQASHGTATASGTSLSYTPTVGFSGSDSFTYTATNTTGTSSSATVTVTVTAPTLALTPASSALTGATVGTAYSQALAAANGTAPYSYAVTSGTLPTGLSLATGGTLSGTPTAAVNASFTVTATDANGATGTASYTLTVAPAALAAPVAGSASATVAANSAANPVTLALSGGTAASVAVASQASHGTATASGTSLSYTPTVGFSGSDSFTYTATNASGTSSAATVTVTVTAPTLALTPASGALTGATVGSAYSQALAAANGTAPYSYAVTSGTLPTGLSLATGGTLSGTPTAAVNASFTVTATDANGATGTASYTLTVAPAALAAPVAGSASATVAANSAANPVTLALSGGTAASVAVASQAAHGTATASGTSISYTPTVGFSGSDSFTYAATNATGTSSPATVTVTVTAPTLALTPASGALTGATVGSAYSQALAAANGTAPYSYAVTSGSLPTGLSLATGGTLSGTPTAAVNASFTVTVTDANGATGTASYTLTVAGQAPPPVAVDATAATVPANTKTEAGQSVSLNLSALVSGQVDDIRIVTQPKHGIVTISRTLAMRLGGSPLMMMALAASAAEIPGQIVAVYTPEAGYQGADSFQYVAVGPGGMSAPATATIQIIGRAPGAQAQTVATTDGQMVSVDLTTAATEGPFTGAAIVSVSPADHATARIVAGGSETARTFRMEVTPKAHFGGTITVGYTLTNAFGTSASATVSVNVTARPDPANDPVVRAISDAQSEATRRFSRAQIANFMHRAESLHGSDCGRSANGLRISSSDRRDNVRLPGEAYDPTDETDRDGTAPSDRTGSRDDAAGETGQRAAATQCEGSVAVWTGGAIDVGTRDAVNGRSKVNATTAGISAGIDAHVAQGVTVGVGGGFGHDSSNIGGDKGHVTGNTKAVALYASVMPIRGMFVDGLVGHGWLDFVTRRLYAMTGLTTRGERDGRYTFGALSAGVDRLSDALRWSLYGRVEYLSGQLDAYREDGAGIYDLRYDDRDLRSVSGVLGFKAGHQRPVSIGLLSTSLRGEWQHEFTGGTGQGLDYADVTGASFYSLGAQGWAREQFTLAPGIALLLPSGWEVGLDLGVRAGGGEKAATASVQVKRRF